jgi:putative transcriptional regulator
MMQELTNNLLVAMPGLEDENFQRSVSIICRHDDLGAMGVMINQKLDVTLGKILEQLSITPVDETINNIPVYYGGPLYSERGFVVHDAHGDWELGIKVESGLYVTSSRDIIEAIARGEGPEHFIIALGCSGWEEGQLEREMLENSWLTVPCDKKIIFETGISERWTASGKLLGIDMATMSNIAGHA